MFENTIKVMISRAITCFVCELRLFPDLKFVLNVKFYRAAGHAVERNGSSLESELGKRSLISLASKLVALNVVSLLHFCGLYFEHSS